jgi:transcriptional/translational regulatory protein YebC/TACO1
VAELRHLFAKNGGNLGESGCVAWMFERRGYFVIPRRALDEERFLELALELGADDVSTEGDAHELYTSVEEFDRVLGELERRGVEVEVQELAMIPQSSIRVEEGRAQQTLRLVEALEDHDDVQHVWANFDLGERVLSESG